MKKQLLVLFFVFVMVASVFGAMSLCATKVAAAGETLTLVSSNTNPASGQQYTLSGRLTDSSGNPIANAPIDIYYHLIGGSWKFSNTIYTGADGRYSTPISSTQTIVLQTGYKINGAYVVSSNVVTISVKIATTLLREGEITTNHYDPYGHLIYSEHRVYGHLKETITRAPIAGATVKLQKLIVSDGQTLWQFVASAVTDGTGYYELPYLQDINQIYFAGSTVFAPSYDTQSGTTRTLTLSASTASPSVGQQYTLSGTLRDSAGSPLANKPIEVWYRYPSETSADWKYSNTVYTSGDGTYSTTASSSQSVLLHTRYRVGSTFYPSNVIAINVHQASTTLTLTSSRSNPSNTEQYSLYGILRDSSGQPLANKPIDIFYHFEGGAWKYSNTVYTDANGYYNTITSSSQTVYLQTGYKVNGAYVVSSSVVKVNARIATRLTVSTSEDFPHSGEAYTLSGRLNDSAGRGLAYKPIEIWYEYTNNMNGYHYSNTIYTGVDGTYSITTSSSQSMFLEMRFQGDSIYAPSTDSDIISVV